MKLPKGATPEGFLGVRKVGRKIAKVVEDVNIYIYIYLQAFRDHSIKILYILVIVYLHIYI